MIADCSIDYERLAAPPILLPPVSIRAAELGSWLEHAHGAERVFATYSAAAEAVPDRVYCVADRWNVRTVSGAPGSSLLPVDRFGDSAIDELFSEDVMDALAGRPARDYHGLVASRLPIPCVEDDALIAVWPPGPPSAPALDLLPDPVGPGPVGDPSSYLLATDGTALTGELDPLLLRAPCTGTVRVDRYQHLLLDGAQLAAGPQSRSGRVLVQSSPPTVFDKDKGAVEAASPLAQPATFTFEHVDVEASVALVAALVEHHVVAFADLERAPRFRQDATLLGRQLDREVTAALTAWCHASSLPAVRALAPDMAMPGNVESTIRDELVDRDDPSTAHIRRACEAVTGDAAALDALRAFLAELYAALLSGRSWRSLGADLSTDTSTAAQYLNGFEQTGNKWIVCYAGAPLGRAAALYGLPLADSIKATYHESLTTFDVEALYVLQDQLTFDWARRADSPPVAHDDLVDYADEQLGRSTNGNLVVMRVSDPLYAELAFSATDWIAEVAIGHQRKVRQPAILDFTALADAGHPLAAAIDWDRRRLAADARARMDQLADARIGLSRLQGVSLGWWSRIEKWTDAAHPGSWGLFGGHPEPARPSNPYRRSGDSRPDAEGAFDELDLYAAIVAAAATRDGKGGGRPTHPAVVLALCHTEGYRNFHRERMRDLFLDPYPPHLPGGSPPPDPIDFSEPDVEAWKVASARIWWENNHGLDICNKRRLSPSDVDDLIAMGFWAENGPEFIAWSTTDAGRNDLHGFFGSLFGTDYESGSRAYFEYAEMWMRTDGVGNAGPDPIVVPGFFPYGGFRPRIDLLMSCGEDPAQFLLMGRKTRELQSIVLTMSLAMFEAHHNWIHSGLTYDRQPMEDVPEYRSADIPPVGNDAASDDRKRFIAYYAGVYLAYNSSPKTWNDWFRAALANKEAARTVPEQFLFGRLPSKNAAYNGSFSNVLRFCAALDVYLRLNLEPDGFASDADVTDPNTRGWTRMR